MKPLFGGILLVAGTSIGAGMLALPVVTAEGGLIPAFFVYLLCWAFMSCTGLLLLELCLRLPPDANLVTMAKTYLGLPGKIFAWSLYLFLFYSLSVAYVSGGGALLSGWTGWNISFAQSVFVGVLGAFVYFGARMVNRLNFFLMLGLILTYFSFIFFGWSHIDFSRFSSSNWGSSLLALPVIFTSFSYQGIIPSLTAYLKRDARSVRIAIIGGTSLAFLIYLLWEILILGIIPIDELLEAKQLGQTAVFPLKNQNLSLSIHWIGQGFAFFAIATSFLGVTLGLFDFLADGLAMPKKGGRKIILALITFLPALIVSLINPNLFIIALVFAGGIGCALLLGFLPTLMVWIARYRNEGHSSPLQLFGGKCMLIVLFLFVFFELVAEFVMLRV